MKKCPTCNKSFEDTMRFCQSDGTPLIDDAPPIDPYKTVVARPEEIFGTPEPVTEHEPEKRAEEPAEPSVNPFDIPAVNVVPPAVDEPEPEKPSVEDEKPAELIHSPVEETIAEPVHHATDSYLDEPSAVPTPIAEPDDLLDIPATHDPLKTMYVSEAEMKQALSAEHTSEEPNMEIPAISDSVTTAQPEPPKFIESEIAPPHFDLAPPSPLAPIEDPVDEHHEPDDPEERSMLDLDMTNPPIPAPISNSPGFDHKSESVSEPANEPEAELEHEPPAFSDAETIIQPVVPPSPFQASEPQLDPEPVHTPEPVFSQTPDPEPEIQTPPFAEPEAAAPIIMNNPNEFNQTPSNFAPPAASGQNQTLAIVSLVCGILGITVCCGSFVMSLVALILGFMARGKATSDPANYGGAGFAMGGMITGAIGLVGGVVLWIVYVLYFAAIMSQMK